MRSKIQICVCVALLLGSLALNAHASAIVIDSVGDTGTLTSSVGGNGVVFGLSPVLQGVGNSKVFLTLNQSGSETTEKGYNTSGTVEFQTIASGTTELLLADVPQATYNSITYYQFVFALNQTGGSPLISINDIEIYQATAGNLTSYGTGFGGATFATKVFDWTSTTTDTLTVYDYIPGLDNTEMLLMVPTANFSASSKPYVTFYWNGGVPEVANDGPDKWIVRDECNDFGLGTVGVTCTPSQVPEPSSLWLLLTGVGLMLMSLVGRRSIVRILRG